MAKAWDLRLAYFLIIRGIWCVSTLLPRVGSNATGFVMISGFLERKGHGEVDLVHLPVNTVC